MNLIIDIGNTSAKLAIFEHNKLKILERSSASKLLFSAKKLLNNNSEISKILVASVATIPDGLIANLSTQCEVMVLGRHFTMPFENLYKTPESLGIDRLALVAAAIDQYPKTNTLIIDAGTCITYDFVNAKAQYLGGAIAPGLNMRYTSKFGFDFIKGFEYILAVVAGHHLCSVWFKIRDSFKIVGIMPSCFEHTQNFPFPINSHFQMPSCGLYTLGHTYRF